MRILLSGTTFAVPHQGGASWAILQWLLGLHSLGHDVRLVEQVEKAEQIEPASSAMRATAEWLGLANHIALVTADGRDTAGATRDELRAFAAGADLLLNLSGVLTVAALVEPVRRRVYVDLDPVFNQLWHDACGIDRGLDAHQHHVTVGLGIGTTRCSVPTGDREWLTTLPPVALGWWPEVAGPGRDFTTIGNWRSYGSFEHDGVHYGQRAHALRPLFALPQRCCDARFRVALAIHRDEHDDMGALRRNGWQLVDPVTVAGTPVAYRRFIQGSFAELGVAKSGYVAAQSGWFSDRSACYLATGRPVVALDTGFSAHLPVGEGLLAFDDIESAAVAVDAVLADPARHRRAARAFAEQHLDAEQVLGKLLANVA